MSKPKQIHLPRSWWQKIASQQAEMDLQLVDIEDEMQHFERLEQRRLAEKRRQARKQAAEAASKRRKREEAARRRREAAEAKPKQATTSDNRRQQATTDNRKPASNLQDASSQWAEWAEWFQQLEQDERERQRRWHLMRRGDPEQLLAIRRGLEMAANGERIPFRNMLRRAGFNYGTHCITGMTNGSPKTWVVCVETGRWHPSERMSWTIRVWRDPCSREVMLSGRRECYRIDCGKDISKDWGELLDSQNENLIYQALLSVIATADGSLLQFGQAFRAGWVQAMMKEGVDKPDS